MGGHGTRSIEWWKGQMYISTFTYRREHNAIDQYGYTGRIGPMVG